MFSYDVNKNVTPNFKALPKGSVRVTEKLIKGASLTLRDVFGMKKDNVKLIVDLRHKSSKYIVFPERTGAKIAGINYVRIPMDFRNGKFADVYDFDRFIKMVDDCDGQVYVHCSGGRHRSAIFCASYLIKKGKKSTKEAIKWILQQDYISPKYLPANNKNLSAKKKQHNQKIYNGLKLTLKQFGELYDKKVYA